MSSLTGHTRRLQISFDQGGSHHVLLLRRLIGFRYSHVVFQVPANVTRYFHSEERDPVNVPRKSISYA